MGGYWLLLFIRQKIKCPWEKNYFKFQSEKKHFQGFFWTGSRTKHANLNSWGHWTETAVLPKNEDSTIFTCYLGDSGSAYQISILVILRHNGELQDRKIVLHPSHKKCLICTFSLSQNNCPFPLPIQHYYYFYTTIPLFINFHFIRVHYKL